MKHIGRKLYHLFGGLTLLALYFVLGRDRAFMVYAVLLAVVLIFEVTRLTVPGVNTIILEHFGSFIRSSEENRITGTAPYILGVGLTLFLYHQNIAAAAVCFLAFGDVAATTVGERWGRTKIGQKSLEGSIAFAVVSVISGSLLTFIGLPVTPGLIIAGAIIAAGVEIIPQPINDNLLIPLVAGGAMELTAILTGCA